MRPFLPVISVLQFKKGPYIAYVILFCVFFNFSLCSTGCINMLYNNFRRGKNYKLINRSNITAHFSSYQSSNVDYLTWVKDQKSCWPSTLSIIHCVLFFNIFFFNHIFQNYGAKGCQKFTLKKYWLKLLFIKVFSKNLFNNPILMNFANKMKFLIKSLKTSVIHVKPGSVTYDVMLGNIDYS